MDKASLSSPKAVAQAVVKCIRRDKAEIVIMPGPGRIMRALLTLFPGMGQRMIHLTGGTRLVDQIVEFREQQREHVTAHPLD
jgi:hypothetical protein